MSYRTQIQQTQTSSTPEGDPGEYKVGDRVKILDGALADMTGVIAEIDLKKGKVTVQLAIGPAGGLTDLRLSQIARV